MTDGRKMICDRCHQAVPLSDVKYLPKGNDSKMALCSACRAQSLPEASQIKSSKAGTAKTPPKDTRPAYFCGRCRYKFKYSADGVTNLKCPYCGKSDKIVEYKVGSAEMLIKTTKYE
jgi:DNA-directed RNA polymerase subunit RPC12/RpoP